MHLQKSKLFEIQIDENVYEDIHKNIENNNYVN
jgi:hypothetical protein